MEGTETKVVHSRVIMGSCLQTSLFNLQVEYDEFNSLSVLGTGGDPVVIPLPNADIPLQVFNIY